MLTHFYRHDYWGMDLGSLSLRADWTAPPRFSSGVDRHRTVWHVVAGPFILTGHVAR